MYHLTMLGVVGQEGCVLLHGGLLGKKEGKKHVTGLKACLHGVGDPGLVGLVSFVFPLWRKQNKRNLPH